MSQVMQPDVVCIQEVEDVQTILQVLSTTTHNGFPGILVCMSYLFTICSVQDLRRKPAKNVQWNDLEEAAVNFAGRAKVLSQRHARSCTSRLATLHQSLQPQVDPRTVETSFQRFTT